MADPQIAGPNSLPIQLTSFIGREREVAQVKGFLSRTRLLTLTGAGGAGKSRLAFQVATEVLEDFADGVWVVELASVADPALVPQAVASVLSVSEQPACTLTDTVVGALRRKSLLLVLDNCEHLQSACVQLANALLSSCPHLRIFTTSRMALGVPGETLWRVPSLSLPGSGRLPSLDHLQQYEAVRLFVERARAVQPTFDLTAANAPAVVKVCHRLDGIPLAIELAAARARVLAAEQIAAKLDDRFRLLTGGSSSALPRHQTLQATMDWSYGLLADKERILLRRLSVFAGGWTLGAAEAICAGDCVAATDILDLLTRLVDKSLVMMEVKGAEARYRLLETVRQYGRDRLQELEESKEILGRHLDFFLRLAEEIEPKLEGAEQEVWVNRLEAEHDNLRAALEWSIKNTAESGLRLVGALGRFWLVRGHFTEGYRWLMEALKIHGSAVQRTKALDATGLLALRRGDYATARLLYEESLSIYRELGDRRGLADAIHSLGFLASHEGDFPSARSFFNECLSIYHEIGARQGIAETLGTLGHVAWHQGDYASARPLLEESLTRSRELGQGRLIIFALWSLGLVAFDQGNYADARSFYREGLATAEVLGDPYFAYLLEACADLAAAEGQPGRAVRLLAAATAFRKALDFPLPPTHRSDYDRPLAMIRATLNEEAFNAAWAEGQTMTLEQAIEYALTATETSPPETKEPEKPTSEKEVSLLTPREQQVAALIAQGLANREIASQLGITERTAETHVRNLLNKMKVNSRTQIAVWAVKHGLQSLNPTDSSRFST
ncbi:MAG TPA: tetratricopeptide repeat protein [bacterium]|nr:tetratricopeptide repeat protein [bacterium]